ncbi:uncharacterized protein BcabD6B2_44330 [Babesia caballi]|uniref:Uncharacterized protein n=1 Tax=Babesia caballi TaxID=5871 RepID=A0AAV4LZ42_BABCB|nr:hypothetical protein, conserved [Babesia caballi]
MSDTSRQPRRLPSTAAGVVGNAMLSRGAALQRLVSLSEHNSVSIALKRYAFGRLKAHAFGEAAQASVSDDPGPLRFSQSQLRLLRQEQLMLMAENERLVYELQEMRRCRTKGQFRPSQSRAVPEFRESKLSKAIDFTLSGARDNLLCAARVALLCALIGRARLRVLGTVFRVLARQPIRSLMYASSRLAGPGQPGIRHMTIACMVLENVIRPRVHRMQRLVLRLLASTSGGGSQAPHRGAAPAAPFAPRGGLKNTDSRPGGSGHGWALCPWSAHQLPPAAAERAPLSLLIFSPAVSWFGVERLAEGVQLCLNEYARLWAYRVADGRPSFFSSLLREGFVDVCQVGCFECLGEGARSRPGVEDGPRSASAAPRDAPELLSEEFEECDLVLPSVFYVPLAELHVPALQPHLEEVVGHCVGLAHALPHAAFNVPVEDEDAGGRVRHARGAQDIEAGHHLRVHARRVYGRRVDALVDGADPAPAHVLESDQSEHPDLLVVVPAVREAGGEVGCCFPLEHPLKDEAVNEGVGGSASFRCSARTAGGEGDAARVLAAISPAVGLLGVSPMLICFPATFRFASQNPNHVPQRQLAKLHRLAAFLEEFHDSPFVPPVCVVELPVVDHCDDLVPAVVRLAAGPPLQSLPQRRQLFMPRHWRVRPWTG